MPQSLANVLIHLVFSTKNRVPLIDDAIRERFHAYAIGVLENIDCPSIQIHSEPDHIHVLLSMSRTKTIAQMVENLKTSTSLWFKKLGPQFREFFWQGGYAAFSVSQSNVETVKLYIQNQREHHRVCTFQAELRALLTKHGIEFDERYMWD